MATRTPPATPREQLLQMISSEYLEMPGLRLTCEQAQRLFAIDGETCTSLLGELVASNFLARAADGRYARRSELTTLFPVPRMARAALPPAFSIKRAG